MTTTRTRFFAAMLLAVSVGTGAVVTAEPDALPEQAVLLAPRLEHVISYGQSLSLGERATGAALDAAPGSVGLMLADGVRSEGVGALVPFAEDSHAVDQAAWNIGTPGETPLYGALLALVKRPGERIGSAAGLGGTSVANLGRGSAPYARLLTQVRAAKAGAAGRVYSVPAVIWMQGESDTTNTAYAQQFTQLVQDLRADIQAISGQVEPVQFFTCLPAPRNVATAQRQVAATLPGVHVACDTRSLAKSDGTHLTAASSREAGRMLGEAVALALN